MEVGLLGEQFGLNGLMTEDDFVLFLKKKKIDPELFKKSEPNLYTEWLKIFLAVGVSSFDQQKKFIFNSMRKKYLLS